MGASGEFLGRSAIVFGSLALMACGTAGPPPRRNVRSFAEAHSATPSCRPAAPDERQSRSSGASLHLVRAREQVEELQFEEAAQTLARAFESPGNCPHDLAEIYWLRGIIDAVVGDRECRRDFALYLALARVPMDSRRLKSKIISCLEDARVIRPERRQLGLRHSAVEMIEPGETVSLPVELVDPLRVVERVNLYFLRPGARAYSLIESQPAARGDSSPQPGRISTANMRFVIPASATIPAGEELDSAGDGYEARYFLQAVNRFGGVLVEVRNSPDARGARASPGQGDGDLPCGTPREGAQTKAPQRCRAGPTEPEKQPAPTNQPGSPMAARVIRGGCGDPDQPPGFVTIDTDVESEIFFDGRKLGRVPLTKVMLPAGTLLIRAENKALGVVADRLIRVEPNKTLRYQFSISADRPSSHELLGPAQFDERKPCPAESVPDPDVLKRDALECLRRMASGELRTRLTVGLAESGDDAARLELHLRRCSTSLASER